MRAISTTSQRAITPRPEGKPGELVRGSDANRGRLLYVVRSGGPLPAGRGVIGLRQVDEMARGDLRGRGANA